MYAFIMHHNGTTPYLCFGEDAVEAAKAIPVPQDEIGVAHSFSIPSKPKAFKIVTHYGGVLLQTADGNNLTKENTDT